jgi:hypothetical protein
MSQRSCRRRVCGPRVRAGRAPTRPGFEMHEIGSPPVWVEGPITHTLVMFHGCRGQFEAVGIKSVLRQCS